MERDCAVSTVEIEVAGGGYFEYLPDPTILFPHARLISSVAIRAAVDASVVVGESFLTHDPDGGIAPAFDLYASEVAIGRLEGAPRAFDRFRIEAPRETADALGLSGGYPMQGAVYLVSAGRPAEQLVEGLREAIADLEEVYAGASTLPGEMGAWVRLLAADGAALRAALGEVWVACRRLVAGREMAPRRK